MEFLCVTVEFLCITDMKHRNSWNSCVSHVEFHESHLIQNEYAASKAIATSFGIGWPQDATAFVNSFTVSTIQAGNVLKTHLTKNV